MTRRGVTSNGTRKSEGDPAADTRRSSEVSPEQGLRETLINAACIILNISSTVLLVFLNKWVFQDAQLKKMQISYAIWHVVCTSAVLFVASQRPFNLFSAVRLPLVPMIPLCALFAGFLVLGNLSLAFNSVTFYQLAKIMTTPCVALIQAIFLGKTISKITMASLAAICMGVALSNFGGQGGTVNTTSLGATIAVAAFVTTAFYQVWIGKTMRDLKVSSPQLLLNQAPISVLLLALVAPFLDNFPDIYAISPKTVVALLLSGLTAAFLNLSQFLVIGRMNALTFNVASNVKTIIILGYGWLLEGKQLTVKDLTGIFLALGGATFYSQSSNR